MRSAVSWASGHTAAAHRAMAAARQFEASYRKAPLVLRTGATAAPPALAARVLQPSDLGTGWYDLQLPNPFEAPATADAANLGSTQDVQDRLMQAHWTGTMWSLADHLILEHMLRFPTPQAAENYLATDWAQPTDGCHCGFGATSQLHLGNVLVSERVATRYSKQKREAAFVVGADLFTLSIDIASDGKPTAPDFETLTATTVRRAITGR
jgi:hypothetical protein